MLYELFRRLDGMIGFKTVSAHCDIPCGIYDPHHAQLAAHTVVRMTDLINKTKNAHQVTRYTVVKEEHAELLKHEIRVLWGDYFKESHEKEHPELAGLVKKSLQQASKARQGIDMKVAEELLTTVQEIAEIFWKTKGLEPVRVKAPYPTGGEIILHK